MTRAADDRVETHEEPALLAINERLRDDLRGGLPARRPTRWNRSMQRAGIDFELKLPHRGFHRAIGDFNDARVSPDGKVISEKEWRERQHEWLPTAEDHAFVQSLMHRVVEPGKFAAWIAPPVRGINNQPADFEYVKLN